MVRWTRLSIPLLVAAAVASSCASGSPAASSSGAAPTPPPDVRSGTTGRAATCAPGETGECDPADANLSRAPDIRNRAQVVQAMQREYPEEARRVGVGGTTNVWIFIDEGGVPRDVRIQESSKCTALDRAARRVAHVMRFTPARNEDGQTTAVWTAFPITFQVAGGAQPSPSDRDSACRS